MIHLLLDEHFSPALVEVVTGLESEVKIQSLHKWQDGAYLNCPDDQILFAAAKQALTLVTFDVTTIPAILQEIAMNGGSHGGVIFVPSRRISQNDYGQIAKRLVALWRIHANEEWKDRVAYLPPM
ncbi:MAG: hypothetical protein ACI9R3_004883 [Verrucomicrobiales bacterium]|jgi:hypothetical protein